MSKHNYTNPAFCQSSEFYPIPSANINDRVGINRNNSFRSNYGSNGTLPCNSSSHIYPKSKVKQKFALSSTSQSTDNSRTCETYQIFSDTDYYALASVEGAPLSGAIVPRLSSLTSNEMLCNQHKDILHEYKHAKSIFGIKGKDQKNQANSFFMEPTKGTQSFISLPEPLEETRTHAPKKRRISLLDGQDAQDLDECKMNNVFANDFKSKHFLLVDKNTNQRYQVVPTSDNEELVDYNREIIQMHNGQTHRYAIIPTEDSVNVHLSKNPILKERDDEDEDGDEDLENETSLSNNDLLDSPEQFKQMINNSTSNFVRSSGRPKKASSSMINLSSYPNTPMKNPVATKMLHDLLSTPPRNNTTRESFRSYASTPKTFMNSSNSHQDLRRHQSLRNPSSLPPVLSNKNPQPQRSLVYESIKMNGDKRIENNITLQYGNDPTTAVIQPRVVTTRSELPLQLAEDECCNSKTQQQTVLNNKFFYPRKLAQATITLAIISLMLVLISSMNLGLILYMIAHLGKSFYLQFSLVAAICGIGLGILGFRSRHCEWLPNRSYVSGYVLVTMFCLLKCCGLLVILVLDPYPGLPLHDITTGIILGLSTFTMFFIGLGVIGSLCCYHPPPDNRINVM